MRKEKLLKIIPAVDISDKFTSLLDMNDDCDECEYPQRTDKPKKRKVKGSKKENARKKRLTDHVTGDDCRCTRLKCFENTTVQEREILIKGNKS